MFCYILLYIVLFDDFFEGELQCEVVVDVEI